MHLTENGVILRDSPFRHGLLVSGLMDSIITRIDIADPIGEPVTIPGTKRTVTFDRPSIGIMAIRKTEKASHSLFFPAKLLTLLKANAQTLTNIIKTAWLERGGEKNAVERNIQTLVSALNGTVHQPDRFGVMHWAPSLSMPFGLVLAGPWTTTPTVADPLSYTMETNQ